ncbi:MAG TPA: hypothetical protein VET88_01700, partial [Gammaproteobacteria bacterium]|nr:hypothetical protein [Gammaproteobacteria bacterium]
NIVYAALVLVLLVGFLAAALLLIVDDHLAGAGYLSGRLLALVAVWAVARSLLDIIRSALLAQQRYVDAARVTALSALTGAVALFTIIQLGELTLGRLLTAHVAGLGIAALLGVFFLKDLGAPRWADVPGTWPAVLRYARWPATSEGTRLLQANLGPLLLVPLAGAGAAGLFGVARYPAYLFEVVAVSLYQYWLPEASIREKHSNLGGYLRLQLLMALAIGLAMVLGAVVCSPFLPLLGENFAAVSTLFVLNAVDFSIFLLTRPIDSVFHGLRKPHLELWPRLIRIPLLGIAAWLLVPGTGALGMVWAHVISGIITLGFAGWLVHRELRQRRAGR